MVLDDFSALRAFIGMKLVQYGRVVDYTLLWHAFTAMEFSARVWHVILIPIGLTLWSGQWLLAARYHVLDTSLPKLRED